MGAVTSAGRLLNCSYISQSQCQKKPFMYLLRQGCVNQSQFQNIAHRAGRFFLDDGGPKSRYSFFFFVH
jgi:hypothetical protein